MQNVGTIEIVILRCKSEGEQVPTPVLAPRVFISRPTNDDGRHTRAVSVAQSFRRKTATPDPSEAFGGMMGGMFDGAGDLPESIKSGELVFDPALPGRRPRREIKDPQALEMHDVREGRIAENRDDRSGIHHGGKTASQIASGSKC